MSDSHALALSAPAYTRPRSACRRLANRASRFPCITNHGADQMTISDASYFALLKTLTDMQGDSDTYAVMGRAWVENQVQVALCEWSIYPASSEAT